MILGQNIVVLMCILLKCWSKEVSMSSNILSGYHKGGSCDLTNHYRKEQHMIAKDLGISPTEVWFLDSDATGEICIYVKGKWSGYLEDD